MGYWSDVDARGYGWSSSMSACAAHILDESLLERLATRFIDAECSFCGAVGEGVAAPVDDLVAIGMEKVDEEFSSADDYGSGLAEMGFDYGSGHSTADAFEEIFEGSLDDGVLAEVASCGGDQVWVPESFLYFDARQVLTGTWEDFVHRVKHRRRFWFLDESQNSERLGVTDFFESVAKLLTRPDIAQTLPTGSNLIRGRMVSADVDPATFDAKELGSPPENVAAANRMSPAGVSMFYGGDSVEVVVAEIGAHSTHSHAVYGTFTTLEDLTIVDLTNLPLVPGYFSEDTDRLQLAFLHEFVAQLVQPVVLDGREHIDYVPTQIVTEYLRYFADPPVHGLRFESSQFPGGLNTVICCDSDRCVNPPGSDTSQDGPRASEVVDAAKLSCRVSRRGCSLKRPRSRRLGLSTAPAAE